MWTDVDNSGVAPLIKEGQLVADTKQKANILNEQFQSVFTTESIDNIPNKGVCISLYICCPFSF
jgi:hypothetical protein